MSTHGDGGKGSARRKEDVRKINENWDRIFGAKAPESSPAAAGNKKQEPTMELDDDGCFEERDEGEWTCDMCGGPMYQQAHWNYAQCDDCGARQELEDDI
jgi:hypothetical protein